MLNLETKLLQIPDIVSMRRLLYYQTSLKKDNDKIVSKVFEAQKKDPSKGDWIELVQGDIKNILYV